jgi:hypothetical protein
MSASIRRTAEIDDDFELQPPELETNGPTPQGLVPAVKRAIETHPNAVDYPVLKADYEGRRVATFTFRPNELPVVDPDTGALEGWLPPYRAQEAIAEALLYHLPDTINLHIEIERDGVFGFYR